MPLRRPITTCLITISLLTGTAAAGSREQSSLSRWLSDDTVPALRERLAIHPRYAGLPVALANDSRDALAAALVRLLALNLSALPQVSRPGLTEPIAPVAGQSIDSLRCTQQSTSAYRLSIQVAERKGRANVMLALLDTADGEIADSWRWRGDLSRAERGLARQAASDGTRQGEPSHPWRTDQGELAAADLAGQLACALRAQVVTVANLRWQQPAALPQHLRDTLSTSRHFIGAFRELHVLDAGADRAADWTLSMRVEALGNGTWQLWLAGEPAGNAGHGVQAVTYLESSASAPALMALQAQPPVALPEGKASDFLAVELLDATQHETSGRRASLQLQLRLENRASWPVEYSLTASGGHYLNCIPQPAYYRHDAWGTARGILAAGESRIARLEIDRARHQPVPLFGAPRCAGFRDIDSFSHYASRGDRITDYVRWHY